MRRLILIITLLCLCLPAQAAVTWFWRLEGTTLDGTHDHANGSADTTATTNGSASLSGTAARVGSTGGLFPASGAHHFRFDTSTDMVNRLVGAVGFSFRVTTAPSGTQNILNISGTAGNYIFQLSAGEIIVFTNLEQAGESSLTTDSAGITTNTWYGIIYRWDHAANLRRIEIYNSSGVEIESVQSNSAFTAPSDLATSAGLRIGNTSGNDAVFHIDNVFIADSYAEPLETNLTITSYTNYGGGGASGLLLRRRRAANDDHIDSGERLAAGF